MIFFFKKLGLGNFILFGRRISFIKFTLNTINVILISNQTNSDYITNNIRFLMTTLLHVFIIV